MNNILVSVIIPTYRRPSLLGRAIDSVLNQTYKNIEIIVVSDNNIADEYDKETEKVIKPYVAKGVKYLSAIGNQGGALARNRGLKVAIGDYVNFLDDDDLFYPDKIEKQVNLILQKGVKFAVVGCKAAIKNSVGKIIKYETPVIYDENDIFFSELKSNICTTSLNLIRTDVIRRSGGFVKIESSQEHLMLLKVFAVEASFDYVDEVLVDINWHEGARISNNSKKPYGALKLSQIIESYYPILDNKKRNIIQLARKKADIYAYLDLREYQKALKLWIIRVKESFWDIDNLKIAYMFVRSLAYHRK